MIGGWAATNTLRERLQERDGDGKHALALVEAALDAAEAFERIPDRWANGDERDRLAAALRAVREGT